jgi:hypothetical protein
MELSAFENVLKFLFHQLSRMILWVSSPRPAATFVLYVVKISQFTHRGIPLITNCTRAARKPTNNKLRPFGKWLDFPALYSILCLNLHLVSRIVQQ